jgi:hypothetical protein
LGDPTVEYFSEISFRSVWRLLENPYGDEHRSTEKPECDDTRKECSHPKPRWLEIPVSEAGDNPGCDSGDHASKGQQRGRATLSSNEPGFLGLGKHLSLAEQQARRLGAWPFVDGSV